MPRLPLASIGTSRALPQETLPSLASRTAVALAASKRSRRTSTITRLRPASRNFAAASENEYEHETAALRGLLVMVIVIVIVLGRFCGTTANGISPWRRAVLYVIAVAVRCSTTTATKSNHGVYGITEDG